MSGHRNPKITKQAIEQIVALGSDESQALSELRVACRFSVLTQSSLGNYRYEDLLLTIEDGKLLKVVRDPERE